MRVAHEEALRRRVGLLLIVAAALVVPAGTALASSPGVATTIGSSGTTSPRTGGFTPSGSGDVTDEEFPGEEDGAEADGGGDGFDGTIVDRSLSHGNGHGVVRQQRQEGQVESRSSRTGSRA